MEPDVLVLAREAILVLRASLGEVSVAYYLPEGQLWKAQVWSDDIAPETAEEIHAGVPFDAPSFARAVQEGRPILTEQWDARAEGLASTRAYGAVAVYPYFLEGRAVGLFIIGTQDARVWSVRDQAIFRAVGRGLGLALERAGQARQLTEQNVELEARTRALGRFAQLARSDETDPLTLIGQAQRSVAELIGEGFAVYYELKGDAWALASQVGSPEDPVIQASLSSALPYATVRNFRIPWESGAPFYQDAYDPALDELAPDALVPGTERLASTAALPLRVNGRPRGIFGYGLRVGRAWTRADRAVLETGVNSLGLALERAERVLDGERQRQRLQEANEELEAFAYSVSHDLRTPVRHITGFLELARQSLNGALNDTSAHYLDVVGGAAGRLNTLIDAMLELARTSRQPVRLGPVDLGQLVERARQEAEVDLQGRVMEWRVQPLPLLRADQDLLRVAVGQLLSNAVKFTRTRDAAVIEVWTEQGEHDCTVFVRDNGVGFDARFQDRLFGIFQRLHRAEDFEGRGLGLALVRRAVQKLGGQVWAQSHPQGATFAFSLPEAGQPQ